MSGSIRQGDKFRTQAQAASTHVVAGLPTCKHSSLAQPYEQPGLKGEEACNASTRSSTRCTGSPTASQRLVPNQDDVCIGAQNPERRGQGLPP